MRQNTGQAANQSKSIVRRELQSKRNNLSTDLRKRHDEAIGRHLLQLVNTRNAGSIACYWPFNGEPDLRPVYQQLISVGCKLALPVISEGNDRSMFFHTWRIDTELAKNWYGILEPQNTAPLPLTSLDMLIMPLVGYDHFGNRLGMGAGYYDRCLESVRDSSVPLRVGIAYSLQEIDPVVKDKWDIPLHGVVNEHGWFTFVSQ